MSSYYQSHSGGNSHWEERERDRERTRKRSASRSRSNSRERARQRARHGERERERERERPSHYYGRERSGSYSHTQGATHTHTEPSATVVVKGLPAHTTEHTLYSVLAPYYPQNIRLITQRDGECKGYAFVEFPSIEYAQFFMATFAGSAGDPRAAQLIVENRSTTIEFARPQSAPVREEREKRVVKTDWLCEACGCQNFARRDSCFRCNLPRSERSASVAPPTDAFGDSLVACETPSAFLVVRGLGPQSNEDQIAELFRHFAPVKSVVLIRDAHQRVTRDSLSFVEFFSVEHAQYALSLSAELQSEAALRISFAKEAVMQQIIAQYQALLTSQMPVPGLTAPLNVSQQSSLVATALQAAQWAAAAAGHSAETHAQAYTPQPPVPPALTHHTQMQQMPIPPPPLPPQSASSHSLPQPPPQPPMTQIHTQQTVFPLPFERNGAAYVFQPRTGYFLDAVREFFYCPKSKLYYNARDGTYWRLCTEREGGVEKETFVRFDPPLPTEKRETAVSEKEGESASESAQREGESEKDKEIANVSAAPKISLSLGKNKAGKAAVNPTAKRALKDIAKWGAIQREEEEAEEKAQREREEKEKESEKEKLRLLQSQTQSKKPAAEEVTTSSVVSAPFPPSPAAPLTPAVIAPSPNTATAEDVKPVHPPPPAPPVPTKPVITASTTAAAKAVVPSTASSSSATPQHVCLLCKRQFSSAEMLSRHEKESKLHAENLAKERERIAASHTYRNRAEERREQFGSVADIRPRVSREDVSVGSPADAPQMHTSTHTATVAAEPVVSVLADESNPGHQLLRKMGWREGQGLGKEEKGEAEAVGVQLAEGKTSNTAMHATIKSTSGQTHTQRDRDRDRDRDGGPFAYRDRESAMAVARARFEQIQKEENK